MSIVPIRDMTRRLPQAGRIRLGEKGAKGPVALAKFRFTASDIKSLDAIAAMYGGEPRPWKDPKSDDAFELYSEASEIEVVLPPDPYDANYELWTGAGNQRRCDGLTCVVQIPGEDGPEQIERACLCGERGVMECKLKLRLNVILPDVRFLGFWRLDTSSKYAAMEMPGVVEAIMAMDGGHSMTRAVLRIEKRHDVVQTKKGPRRKNYNVPCLGFSSTLNEIAAGRARVSIGAGSVPPVGLSTGDGPPDQARSLPPGGHTYSNDDEVVVDAEVIEDDREDFETWASGLSTKDQGLALRLARTLAEELGEPVPMTFDDVTGRTLEAIYAQVKEDR